MARGLVLLLVTCLLARTFAVPAGSRPGNGMRPQRADTEDSQNDNPTTSSTSSYDIDADDDDLEAMQTSPSEESSNVMSLLNLVTALLPSASGSSLETMIRRFVREYFLRNPIMLRRQDVADNVIEIDYVNQLTPPFLRQEADTESNGTNESDNSNDDDDDDDDHGDDDDSNGDDDDHGDDVKSEENDNAAEESVEQNTNGKDKASKQDSGLNDDGNDDDDSESDSDEPPGGGDGEGGGVLGLLAGLSGGEDGQSDLGSLLAAVSGIVGSLSGDGFDLNALIATGFGLFVGLLSEGEENPGSIIASYLLTSLDTITGGGAKNNGAYFGSFLSKLIKGTSAVSEESGSGSDEENGNKMQMADSTGFFVSLLMSLSGDMSKGSSGGSSAWR